MSRHWFHGYLYEYYSKNKMVALDVGCGTRPYHNDYRCNYIGLDLPSRTYEKIYPDIFAEASTLPFRDKTFDFVVSSGVLPYIKDVDMTISEMHRILKSDGLALIIIMNLNGLALHPNDHFWNRWNSRKLKQKLKEHKFKSVLKMNLKALLWATYFDITSVYSYAVVTPIK